MFINLVLIAKVILWTGEKKYSNKLAISVLINTPELPIQLPSITCEISF